MRGWTYSSKNPERPPDSKKTKEENHLVNPKRKKRSALEWDNLDIQAGLKSFLYIDCSLRAKKDNLIDELNFKKCMQLKRSRKSKSFAGITNK